MDHRYREDHSHSDSFVHNGYYDRSPSPRGPARGFRSRPSAEDWFEERKAQIEDTRQRKNGWNKWTASPSDLPGRSPRESLGRDNPFGRGEETLDSQRRNSSSNRINGGRSPRPQALSRQYSDSHAFLPERPRGGESDSRMDLDPASSVKRNPTTATSIASLQRQSAPSFQESSSGYPQIKFKDVMKSLSGFTSSCATIASLSAQREIADKQIKRRKLENEKWRRQRYAFVSLAEQQDREMQLAEAASASIVKELEDQEEIHQNAMETMTIAILTNGSVAAPLVSVSSDREKLFQLQRELSDLRLDVSKKSNQEAVASKEGLLDLERHLTELQRALKDHDSLARGRLGTVTDQVDKVQGRVDSLDSLRLDNEMIRKKVAEIDNAIIGHVKDLSDLNEGITALNDDHRTRIEHTERVEATINKMNENMQGYEHDLKEVRELVIGENGLIDVTKTQESNLDKFRQTITRFDKELDQLISECKSQTSRIARLESAPSLRENPKMSAGDEDQIDALREIPKAVEVLNEDIEQLKQDQASKDEILGQGLDNLVSDLEDAKGQLKKFQSDFDAQISTVNDNISSLQSRSIPQASSTRGSTTADGGSTVTDAFLESLPATIKEHRNSHQLHHDTLMSFSERIANCNKRIIVCENFQISLNQRFDNLTTEHMAQNVIHQMQILWPNAGSLKAEVECIKEREKGTKSKMSTLSKAYEALQLQCNALEHQLLSSDSKKAAQTLRIEFEMLQKNIERMVKDTEKRTILLDEDRIKDKNSHKSGIDELAEIIDGVKEDYTETYEPLRKDLDEVKREQQELEDRVGQIDNTTIAVIAELSGSVEVLIKKVKELGKDEYPDNGTMGTEDGEDGDDDPIPPIARGRSIPLESPEQASSTRIDMTRKKLLKRRDNKRKQGERSSDLEEDQASKRKTGEDF